MSTKKLLRRPVCLPVFPAGSRAQVEMAIGRTACLHRQPRGSLNKLGIGRIEGNLFDRRPFSGWRMGLFPQT